MIKMCIISGAEDSILQKFLDSLKNIKEDYRCFILRNKPANIKITNQKVTMVTRPNSDYVEDGNVKFVKLRCDSVRIAKPDENDIIMLGDDDMIFLEGFTFNSVLPLFDHGVEHVTCMTTAAYKMDWEQARKAGIWLGQYMKYRQAIWTRIEARNGELLGGGEDSLIALIYYYDTFGKTVRAWSDKVTHTGSNHTKYFDGKNLKDPKFLVNRIESHADLQEPDFDKEATELYLNLLKKGLLNQPELKFFIGNEEHNEFVEELL
jgi:hypothetical protein